LFEKGAEAFGLLFDFDSATELQDNKAKDKESLHFGESSIAEAKVVGRNENVQVHAEITQVILILLF